MVAIILLVMVCLANIILGVFVLANNAKARLNKIFAALAFSLAIWSLITFFEDFGLSETTVSLLVKLDFVFAIIMVGFFCFLCFELGKFYKKSVNIVILALAVANIALIAAGQTVHLVFEQNKVKFVPQAGYFVFLIYIGLCMGLGLYALVGHYIRSQGKEKSQLRLVLIGLFLSAMGILITNVVLPNLYNVGSIVTRIGIYGILFLTGFSAYAIVRHRWFNMRLVVARSVAYLLLLASLAAFYAVGIFGLSQSLFSGAQVGVVQNIFYIILALVLAFTFQPLRRFFERLTDSIFYRDKYDSQIVLTEIGKILASEIILEKLLADTLKSIAQNLHIDHGQFYIFNEGKIYKVAHYGPLPKRIIVVPELKHLRRNMIVADELEGGEVKRIMEDHGIRFSMLLKTKEEFVGFLLLGDKLSGDIYSEQDTQLLEILSSELAVAIQNAKAYEEISQFNITLQDKVDEATKRLRKANANLKTLDKAKDEFISMASHQLRTPLTTIKGYISMILEGDTGAITDEQKEFLNYAFDSSQRMVGLISDLLNVSRLSAGRFMIDRTPTDIIAVAADEVRQLQTHAESKHLDLIFDHPSVEFPLVNIDENKTRQVMMNFIDNALYYTKEGSVTISLELDEAKKVVRFRVRDTGIGVPKAALAKLFTKFFRADNAQTARPDGTGLGLYLAKRVVEDQGGTILVESEEGKGSMFGFELPLVSATAKPAKTDAIQLKTKTETKPKPSASSGAKKIKVTKVHL
jgi:signal transduction histidine kinase